MSKLQMGGEWLELDPVNKDVGKLRFKVRPLSSAEQYDNAEAVGKDMKASIGIINKIILDWELDLTVDDHPLSCTDENKATYIPYLIAIEVKGGSGTEGLGTRILDFAQNFGNFIKN